MEESRAVVYFLPPPHPKGQTAGTAPTLRIVFVSSGSAAHLWWRMSRQKCLASRNADQDQGAVDL